MAGDGIERSNLLPLNKEKNKKTRREDKRRVKKIQKKYSQSKKAISHQRNKRPQNTHETLRYGPYTPTKYKPGTGTPNSVATEKESGCCG